MSNENDTDTKNTDTKNTEVETERPDLSHLTEDLTLPERDLDAEREAWRNG